MPFDSLTRLAPGYLARLLLPPLVCALGLAFSTPAASAFGCCRAEAVSTLPPAEDHVRTAFGQALRLQGSYLAQVSVNGRVVAKNAISPGRIEDAVSAAHRALVVFHGVGVPVLRAESMPRTVMRHWRKEQFDGAVTTFMQRMDAATDVPSPPAKSFGTQTLRVSYDNRGLTLNACNFLVEMAGQAGRVPSLIFDGGALLGLAAVQYKSGKARANHTSSCRDIEIHRATGNPFYIARGPYAPADFPSRQRRHGDARPLYDESAEVREGHVNKIGVARYQEARTRRLAVLAAARGDEGQAFRVALEVLSMAERVDRERASSRLFAVTDRSQAESQQREAIDMPPREELQSAQLRQRDLGERWLWSAIAGGVLLLGVIAYIARRQLRSRRVLETLNAELQRTRNRLQATLDAVPDLLFVLDLSGRYLEYHSPRTDLLAAPPEQLIGKTVQDALPAAAANVCMAALREAEQQGHSVGQEFELALPQGHCWFELSVARKTVATGQIPRFVVLARDITARKEAEWRLHEQGQAIRAAVENSPDYIIRYDRQCRRVYVNPAAQEQFGTTVDRLLGKLPGSSSPLPLHLLEDVLTNGRELRAEFPFRSFDGTTAWTEVRLIPEFDPGGQVATVLSVGRDITERKLSDAALRESEERYRTLIQKIQVGVVVHTADTRILVANTAAQELLGLTEDSLLGKLAVDPVWHFLREDGSLATLPDYPVNRVLYTRQPLRDCVMGIYHPDRGAAVWVLVNADPVFDKSEEIVQVIVTFIDITQRVRDREELAAREREFHALAENLPDTVVRFDRDCRRIYVNQAVLEMSGREPAELLGRLTVDYTPVVDSQRYQKELRRVIDEGKPSSLEVQVRRADGGAGWAWVSMVPEFDDHGQVVGVMAVGRDTTERKRMEEALVIREREFRTLAENSPDLIMRYDIDCQRTYVNPAYVRETHVPITDALNVTPRAQWSDRITPPVDEYLGVLRKVMASGEPADLTVSWMRATDNSTVFHALRIVAERDAEHRVVGALAIGRNITEQKLVEQELKEREQRYRGIFDNVSDTLYLLEVTPQGRFRNLEINPAFEKASGISSEHLIDKYIEETLPPEMADAVIAKYRRCVETGVAIDEEVTLDLPSGRRYYHSTLVPVRDDNGRVYRIVGISRDITERKLMEDALVIREREFRTLAENLPNPIYRYDRECRRLYVNPVVGRIVGKPVKELIGSSPADGAILISEQNKKLMEAVNTVFLSGEDVRIELQFHDKDGMLRDYQMLLVPERDASGQVSTVLAVAHDLTVARNAERRITRFLANVPGFVYSFRLRPDGQFSFPFASPGIRDIYGLQPEDVLKVGKPGDALIHPEDAPRLKSAIMESARTLHALHVEFRVRPPDQPERWIECRALPEREPEGDTLWHGLMLDITQRKRMEQHIESSRQQLRELAARSEAAREDERRHLKREIHDELGQYLLALRLGVAIVDMQFGPSNPVLQKRTQRLIDMVDSTIKVVRDLVTLLRPPALEMGIVSALEWLISEYADKTEIQFHLNVYEDDIQLDDIRATAVFRIVQESLTNIVKHAQASNVTIKLERSGDDFVLEVFDDGRGFSPASRKEGSFGLAGIRERALMLGGSLKISSVPGRTVLRVTFPIQETQGSRSSQLDAT